MLYFNKKFITLCLLLVAAQSCISQNLTVLSGTIECLDKGPKIYLSQLSQGDLLDSLLIKNDSFKLVIGDKAPLIKYQKSYPNNYVIPKGKAIVLDFWATWCAPCVAGLMETNNFIDKYSDNLEFIAITDTTSRDISNFRKIKNFKHIFLLDETDGTFKNFGVESIPYAFLIDKNGIIQWVGHGQDLKENMLNEFLTTGHIRVKVTNSEVSSFSSDAFNKLQKIKALGNYKFSFQKHRKKIFLILSIQNLILTLFII